MQYTSCEDAMRRNARPLATAQCDGHSVLSCTRRGFSGPPMHFCSVERGNDVVAEEVFGDYSFAKTS